MSAPLPTRFTTGYDGDVVVFCIGMRINAWRRLRSWLPVFAAMPRMLRELSGDPGSGLLASRTYWSGRVIMCVQYWRSAADLESYARNPDRLHRPAWAAFHRHAARGGVGMFHETYVVPAGAHESLYLHTPPLGLAAATGSATPVGRRRQSFRERLEVIDTR